MTLQDLQASVADALDADPALRAGGVRVFAEDRGDIAAEIARQLQQAGGVAGIVATPEASCLGGDSRNGIALEVETLAVSFAEIPALNRLRAGHLTALGAAQRAALLMHGERFHLDGIRQSADRAEGAEVVLTATATFRTSATITNPENEDQ